MPRRTWAIVPPPEEDRESNDDDNDANDANDGEGGRDEEANDDDDDYDDGGVEEDPDASVLRILLSTDNHLGYLERDPIRGRDSFAAFEEVLSLARMHGVDMVLLSGDLFHDNKPSRKTLHAVSCNGSSSFVDFVNWSHMVPLPPPVPRRPQKPQR